MVTHQGQSRVGGSICNAKTKFGPHNQEIPTACTYIRINGSDVIEDKLILSAHPSQLLSSFSLSLFLSLSLSLSLSSLLSPLPLTFPDSCLRPVTRLP